MQDKITIYTDGSCLGNPGPGGWAVLIIKNKKEEILKGGEPDTTNNRMEMTAILNAIKWLNENVKSSTTEIELFSDSSLLINSISKGWKRKANTDIWEEIDEKLNLLNSKGIRIAWNWVKGHHTDKFNAKVDEIAVEESNKQPKGHASVKKSDTSKSPGFFCSRCKKEVKGDLSFLPDSGMIRADCEHCGKYIKFADTTAKNLRQAKLKILISKAQLDKVVDIMQNHGKPINEKVLKNIKTWSKQEAENFINEDNSLF
jgi:ribonuclease HI